MQCGQRVFCLVPCASGGSFHLSLLTSPEDERWIAFHTQVQQVVARRSLHSSQDWMAIQSSAIWSASLSRPSSLLAAQPVWGRPSTGENLCVHTAHCSTPPFLRMPPIKQSRRVIRSLLLSISRHFSMN